MIPDMTTGIRLYERLVGVITGEREGTFIMSSGLKVPTPAMLMPAFAVPYAAPIAIVSEGAWDPGTGEYHLHVSGFYYGDIRLQQLRQIQ
jgi:hypothetical protein